MVKKIKKIGIITTGGDCSGLNTAIYRIIQACNQRGWKCFGILDGMDGLMARPQRIIPLTMKSVELFWARISGSYLQNGSYKGTALGLKDSILANKENEFIRKMTDSVKRLGFDALILIGGNGSMSLAYRHLKIYNNLQFIGIPKTIDMDVPGTDITIGFSTAVSQLTQFSDDILMSARSHHRWFIIQAMGRDVGYLPLTAGIASYADAIIIPEIAWSESGLLNHIKKIEKDTGRDWGIIMVSEGVKSKSKNKSVVESISEMLFKNKYNNRVVNPGHLQRGGDSDSDDRIVATSMAMTAIGAIEAGETNVLVVRENDEYKTISLDKMFHSGEIVADPKVPNVYASFSYVEESNPLLKVAKSLGIYLGDMKTVH